MLKKYLFSFFLCCHFCFLAVAQTQSENLMILSTQIHDSLDGLKQQSKILTLELQQRSNEVKNLKTNLSELTTSLDNTNALLANYETKLIVYEQKLKTRAKVIWAAAIVIMINILGKMAAIALRFKGIKLPEVFNILW